VAVEDRERDAEEAFLAGRLDDAVQAWTHAHTEAPGRPESGTP
jgi:hypothetical protein